MWLAQSVAKLVRHGHSSDKIADYTLEQFVIFLDAAEQIEAEQRIAFVTDVATSIGQLFNKDPIVQDHLDLLRAVTQGARDGNRSPE